MSKRSKKAQPSPKGGKPGREKLVPVEDAWGRKHKVPRAALWDPPPSGAAVIDLTTPGSTEAWLRKTGRWEEFTRTSEVTIRTGDIAVECGVARDWTDLAEQLRRGRTEAERKWLLERRTQMEDELVKFDLPRNAWRQLGMMQLLPERVDDPQESCLLLESSQRKGLTDRVLTDPDGEETKGLLWAAAVARVCADTLEARNPESRLLLGRLLERFEAHRRFPDQGDKALRRLLADHLRKISRLPRKRSIPHIQLVGEAVTYLRNRGHRHGFREVKELLTGKIPDEIRDAIEPVNLNDPAVEVEAGEVFFRFTNRDGVRITEGRLRNIISEARNKGQHHG